MKTKVFIVLLVFGILSSATIISAWGPSPIPDKQELDWLSVHPAFTSNPQEVNLKFRASYFDYDLYQRVSPIGIDLDVIVWDKKSKKVMMEFPAKSDYSGETHIYPMSNEVVKGMYEGRVYRVDFRVSAEEEDYYSDEEGHAGIEINGKGGWCVTS